MALPYTKLALFKDGPNFYDWSLHCMGNGTDKKRIDKIEEDQRFVSWYTDSEIDQKIVLEFGVRMKRKKDLP